MSLKRINTVLATVVVLFSFYLGVSFLLAPEASAEGFGLPAWPTGDAGAFLMVKGNRELAMGLALGVLLIKGYRRPLGWALLMTAVAPFGDMITVLTQQGSIAAALGIHGLTAAFIAVAGLLMLREAGKSQVAPAPAPAVHAA